MNKTYETIVIGLGAMGSAAAFQLARKGSKVLGIDQFTPPHTLGSSHGDTRITRQAIGEGPEYVPLVLRSYEIWDEIERETGKVLLHVTGGLIMTGAERSRRHGSDFFPQTVAAAQRYNIAHSLLDAREIARRYPQFKLKGNEKGYFEEKAGYLKPELCIEAQLELARRYGADLAFHEKVVRISPGPAGDHVVIKTTKGGYEAEKAILSAGPWVSSLLGDELGRYFTVYRQVLYWFEGDGSTAPFEAPHFPVWIWEFGMGEEEMIYGFPAINGPNGGVKIASEQYTTPADPDTVSREVTEQEIQRMFQNYVRPHLHGLTGKCVKAVSCLYTVTPDHRFVIDRHPDFPQVILASPCSGHGFKHSAAIGEVLAEIAVHGESKIDTRKFKIQ